ncbi:MAG: hypothetical protein EXQ60_05425 [Candidatus Nanopelagicales bacterium]|nr:hypothetical protein [Candidatus Nanopelagicales bacterium]
MKLRQGRLFAALAASALAAGLLITVAPGSMAAPASPLIGTWVGSADLYYGGKYSQGTEKLTITTARGNVAKGTWQWKPTGGRWSSPAPVQLIALNSAAGATSIDILGADGDGTYEGVLIPGVSFEIGYMAPRHGAGTKTLVLHSLMIKAS